MGGKRIIQRYKNIFCTAGCLTLLLFALGCQYHYYPKVSLETVEGREGREYLQKASDQVIHKNFQEALIENQKAYDFSPPPLKQEAIFQKALIYAHPENPERNYDNALVCFDLLDKNPDDTILAHSAMLVYAVLKESSDLSKKTIAVGKDIDKMKKKLEESRNRIEKLLDEQQKLKNHIAKLQHQISQLKAVDLGTGPETKGVSNE